MKTVTYCGLVGLCVAAMLFGQARSQPGAPKAGPGQDEGATAFENENPDSPSADQEPCTKETIQPDIAVEAPRFWELPKITESEVADLIKKHGDPTGLLEKFRVRLSVVDSNETARNACMAYRATNATYETGNATPEDVYRWSKRWMEAARSGSDRLAAREHLERMQHLRDRVEALYKTGSVGGEAEKYSATLYYVAEAEQWVDPK